VIINQILYNFKSKEFLEGKIMVNVTEVIRERKYKAGYVVRDEYWDSFGEKTLMKRMAYTPNGDWIGTSKEAHRLVVKYGIAPEKIRQTDCICSIGFSERDQKWYGWSHRAMCGFGIGDVVKEGDCTAMSGWTAEYLSQHPEEDMSLPVGFTAKTLDDAKRMAIAFADSVS